MSVDPLAEKYPAWNPYHYVHNNPIRLIDPTGMGADTLKDGRYIWEMTEYEKSVAYGNPMESEWEKDYRLGIAKELGLDEIQLTVKERLYLWGLYSGLALSTSGSTGALQTENAASKTSGLWDDIVGSVKNSISKLSEKVEGVIEDFFGVVPKGPGAKGYKRVKDLMKGGKQSQRDREIFQYPKEFRRWFHREYKQPGDPDASKELLKELYKEWKK